MTWITANLNDVPVSIMKIVHLDRYSVLHFDNLKAKSDANLTTLPCLVFFAFAHNFDPMQRKIFASKKFWRLILSGLKVLLEWTRRLCQEHLLIKKCKLNEIVLNFLIKIFSMGHMVSQSVTLHGRSVGRSHYILYPTSWVTHHVGYRVTDHVTDRPSMWPTVGRRSRSPAKKAELARPNFSTP